MANRKLQVLYTTITKLLRKNAHRRILFIIEKVHLADLAVVFRLLNDDQQDTIFSIITDPQQRAELLENLDDAIALRLVRDYSPMQLAEVVKLMSQDDATDLMQDMDEGQVEQVLALLKKDDREELRDLIRYEDDTAGGLMTTDFVFVQATNTAQEALQVVQDSGDEAEMLFYIYVVDEDERLAGVVSLRELVQSDDDILVSEIMETDIHKVRPTMDQEDVARMIARYDLLAVPVVDDENRMCGIITVDDIIDVIREENTEDILKLVGTDEELFEDYSIKRNILSRFPWLLATWIGGIVVMKLVGAFEEQLLQVVALTAFFPVILGMSGNVGQQSATIIVRGIAIGVVNVSQLTSTLIKEMVTGFVIGVAYGALLGLAAWWEFGEEVAMIALVVGLSQCAAMTFAAIFGAFVPMTLHKMNIDPAVATGPIVTTTLDIVAMLIYFGIATLLIF